uniref:Hypothetical secreted protein n=1 Tax=Hyalomma rufipes TaxID=72862 RepID=E2J6Q3_HYARU
MEFPALGFLFLGLICHCLEYACASYKCGPFERPVRRYPRTDRFCKPWLTMQTELQKLRWCVCQNGYVRNAWGHCIKESECMQCIYKRNVDYNQCSTACPLVCGQRPPSVCTMQCVIGCACAPGFVLLHRNGPCISIRQCVTECPRRNQYFTPCRSPCPATCANPFPSNCPEYCAGEGCVCKPGFLALHLKPLVCVRPEQCPGFSGTCRGKNQVYTTCMSRCPATCWDKEPPMCAAVCSGTGCVCKPGFVIAGSNPLVCVHPTQCAAFKNTSDLIHV